MCSKVRTLWHLQARDPLQDQGTAQTKAVERPPTVVCSKLLSVVACKSWVGCAGQNHTPQGDKKIQWPKFWTPWSEGSSELSWLRASPPRSLNWCLGTMVENLWPTADSIMTSLVVWWNRKYNYKKKTKPNYVSLNVKQFFLLENYVWLNVSYNIAGHTWYIPLH
jgi:hypothetical protein